MQQPSLFDDDAPAHEPAPAAHRGKVKATAPPLPEHFAEPATLPPGFPAWFRGAAADDLAKLAAEVGAGGATDDELMRYLRGSLYLLGRAELVGLADWLNTTLRAS